MSNSNNEQAKIERTMALVLLVKEILDQVDDISSLKSQGCKANIGAETLKETCFVLRELDSSELERYYELLISLAGKSVPSQNKKISFEMANLMTKPRKVFVEKIKQRLQAVA